MGLCGFSPMVRLRANARGGDAAFGGWVCRHQPERHVLQRFSKQPRPERDSIVIFWVHCKPAVFDFGYRRRRFKLQQPRVSQFSRSAPRLVAFAGTWTDEME